VGRSEPRQPYNTWHFYRDVLCYILLSVQIFGHLAPGASARVDFFSHGGGAVAGVLLGLFFKRQADLRRVEESKTSEERIEEAKDHKARVRHRAARNT